MELDDFYAEAIADGSCFYAEEAFCRDSLRFDPLRLDGVHDRLVRDRLEDMRLKDMRLKDRARCLALEERSTEQVGLETKSRRKRDAQEDIRERPTRRQARWLGERLPLCLRAFLRRRLGRGQH